MIVGQAQGGQRGREAARVDLRDVVVVEVEPEEPAERLEEVERQLRDVVGAEEDGAEGILEMEEADFVKDGNIIAEKKT